MRRNRRNRRAIIRRSPNDDRDDVDGSENTASETDIGNLPPHGLPPDCDPDGGDHDPEPDAKRQRVTDNEAIDDIPSSSSGSVPLINVAAAIPCAAASPLSLTSHPLYHANQTGEEDTNDQRTENSNRDNASASRREGSPFQ